MTWSGRIWLWTLLTIVAIVPASLRADNVQLTIHDGRVSLVATNATPAEIFEAWSRAGGVLIVNADRVPSTPVTLRLDNVPEAQALDTLLRPVSGYLARRRLDGNTANSAFDRIVILPTAPMPRDEARPAVTPGGVNGGAPVVFPQPPRAGQPMPPTQPAPGIPQGPGVTRLVGPDGQPVEDDQADAPPAPSRPQQQPQPYSGDSPSPYPQPQPTPVQPGSAPSAPAGVPVPGMVVPAPSTPGQQPQNGAPTQPGQ
jgi:hypothetical protein